MLASGLLYVVTGINRAREVESALPGAKAIVQGVTVPRTHLIRTVVVDHEVDRSTPWWRENFQSNMQLQPIVIVLEPKP